MKKIVNYNILISAIFALFIVISLVIEKLLNTQMFYSTNIIPIISIIYGIANIILLIFSKIKGNWILDVWLFNYDGNVDLKKASNY